jgi:hypothetical protein
MVSVAYNDIKQGFSLPPLSAGFFFNLFFYPEDGDDMFFRNVGLSPSYTAIQHIGPYSA